MRERRRLSGTRTRLLQARPLIRFLSARPLPDYNHEVIVDVVEREGRSSDDW